MAAMGGLNEITWWSSNTEIPLGITQKSTGTSPWSPVLATAITTPTATTGLDRRE